MMPDGGVCVHPVMAHVDWHNTYSDGYIQEDTMGKISTAIPCLVLILSALLMPTILFCSPTPPKCYWALNMDRFVCAPAYGDIVVDINTGNFLCGRGQCVINPAGKIRCSSVTGGAAVIDSHNRASCVGGCSDAEESLCVSPRP
jgi:hypothetical protein